ncbi:MAG: putative ABC transport system permease protein [Pseudohongiellaceae bacterium]|jgi:putative ABC transport system permease protein
MRLVLLLAWRQLVFNPGKMFASVLGIAVGMATVVSVLTVDHNTLLTQVAKRNKANSDATLVIQPDLRSALAIDEVAADLRDSGLVEGVTAYASSKYGLLVEGRIRSGVELFALERGATEHHGAYVVSEGEDLNFDSSDVPQLLVSQQVADQAKLSVGDLIDLAKPPAKSKSRGPRTVFRCIDGLWVDEELAARPEPLEKQATPPPTQHPFKIIGILAPTRLGFGGARVITTFATGQDVMGRNMKVNFWADFDPSVTDLREIQRDLGDSYAISSPRRSLAGLAPEERAFRSGVRFCGFLALFLGLYIIFNTMSMSLVERVRSIGLLRSLGLTRGRLGAVFLVEGLVLSLLGAGLALVLADQIVSLMVDWEITTLGRGKPLEILEIPWNEIGAVLLAGVVFCLLGVLYPFARASKLSVIDALRRGVIELSNDPFTGARRTVLVGLLAVVPIAWIVGAPSGEYLAEPLYHAVLTGFGLVGGAFTILLLVPAVPQYFARLLTSPIKGPAATLARATLKAARHRVFASVSGLMLVFTAIFLIVSVLESLKGETRHFGERALEQRLYLKVSPDGVDKLPALAALAPEFEGMLPLNAEVMGSFLVRGVDVRMLDHTELIADEALAGAFISSPSIILSSRCADDFDKQPGDTVRLATPAAGLVDFDVLAVSDSVGFCPDDRVYGVVSSDTLLNYWCEDGYGLGGWLSGWVGDLDDERLAALNALAMAVIGDEDLIDLTRGEDITAGYVADLDRNFAMFYAILALTILLAAVGILNAMVIAVMERRREIGLLRAVGLTGGQVASMLLIESGVLGVLGGVFGLLLGVPLAVVTAEALTEVSHLDLAYELSPTALAAVLGGAVLISLLAVLGPALRANHLQLSRVMRYE